MSPEIPPLPSLFDTEHPIDPGFLNDAIRHLMRAQPLKLPKEPQLWADRRCHSSLIALSALRPREEIELMLSVQAISAYNAANALFYHGMNGKKTPATGLRQLSLAASMARTFDTLLKGIERRQARAVTPHRHNEKLTKGTSQDVVREVGNAFLSQYPAEGHPPKVVPLTFSEEDLKKLFDFAHQAMIDKEHEGLDIANTEGILPGGGMIMPEKPTQAQKDYMETRLKRMYFREYEENVRKGINEFPQTRPLRPGDFVP